MAASACPGNCGHRGESGNRQPEIRDHTDVDGATVIRGADADDRRRHPFNPNDASDDGWVRAERSGPRLIPEHGDDRRATPLVHLAKPAAQRRPQSQDVEIGRRRVLDRRVPYRAVVQVAGGVRDAGGHRRREDIGVLRYLLVGGIRADDERPAGGVVLIDVDEAIGVGERLTAEQRRIHQAEDRGVGADGEAEDEHGRRGEAPVAHQPAEAVARVARQRIESRRPARVAPGFLLDDVPGPHGYRFTWGGYVGRIEKFMSRHCARRFAQHVGESYRQRERGAV